MSSFQISLEKFWQRRLNFKRKFTRTICFITLRCVIAASLCPLLASCCFFLENIIRSAPCDFNFRVTTLMGPLFRHSSIRTNRSRHRLHCSQHNTPDIRTTCEPWISTKSLLLSLFVCARGMLSKNLKRKSDYPHDRRISRRSSYCALRREGKYS